MARLIPEYERLYKENIELKERINELENKLSYYLKIEQTLNSTLLTAQDASEEIKSNAKKEAELILRDAEQRAKQIKQRTSMEIEEQLRILGGLKQQISYYKTQFKALLNIHLEMLAGESPPNLQAELEQLWNKYTPLHSEIKQQLEDRSPEEKEAKDEAGSAEEKLEEENIKVS